MDPREFVKSFVRIFGKVGLYGPSHPASEAAIDSFLEVLGGLLKSEREITVTAADGRILVNGAACEEKGPLFEAFAKIDVHSIAFTHDAGKEGVLALLKAMTTSPGPGGVEGALEREGAAGIRLNTVHYVKTGERIDAGDDASLEAVETLEGLSFEILMKKVIEKAVRKEEDRKKVFECVMGRFKCELDGKVREATRELENEKNEILRDKENTESVIASAVLGSITVDDGGNVLMLDEDGSRVVGKTLGEKAGRPVWEGLAEGQMVTVSRGSGALTVRDLMVTGEDETRRVLKASSAIIRSVEGRMVGLFSVLSDITKYRELDQMKKDFVANVTHELRTPLVATKQALSNLLALTGGLDADQKKMIEIALRNTERLSRLVNDILDFSKLEAGRLKLCQEIVETGPLLKEIISSLTPLSGAKGITLRMDCPQALPRIFADRDRITQVFVNLLSNAIKFTERGGAATVEIAGIRAEGQNPFLCISVRDTGRGIGREEIKKIFEKFVQVGAAENSVMRGTGLGLTITKAIVELHGGRVNVESEPGAGSVFTVEVPMLPEDAAYFKNHRSSWSVQGKRAG